MSLTFCWSTALKSSEQLIMQDVWRQAWRRGEEGLELTFRTRAGAQRARMQLYNAVKLQKAGKDLDDLELVKAAEGLEIVWVSETSLRLQRKDTSDMMQGIAQALGRNVNDYVDPEALAAGERMLRELGLAPAPDHPQRRSTDPQPNAEHQDTPFYTVADRQGGE
jgi:hypothetical protein